jgi:hypothetical protein
MTIKELLLLDDVENTINTLVSNVDQSFVMVSEELGGWHHYLTSRKASALGTALGLACLSYKIKRLNRKVILGITLLEKSINDDDGYGIKIIEGGKISLTESTSYICLSLITLSNRMELSKEYRNKVVDLIKKCVMWLIVNRNSGEGFGPRRSYESRVCSTCIAVIALQKALEANIINDVSEPKSDIVLQVIKDAINWLIDAKNDDGGWGELSKNQKSTAFHTSISIMALKCTRMVDEDRLFKKAKGWLLTNWNETDLWEKSGDTANLTEMYDIYIENQKWSRAIWNHFPSALAIVALHTLGNDFATVQLFKGIKWMLTQSRKGYVARITDSSPPIWAIWDTLLVLDTFVTFCESKFISLYEPKRFLVKAIGFAFHVLRDFSGYIILLLYVLVGLCLVLKNLLSTENYVIGLLVPISFIILERVIKGKK